MIARALVGLMALFFFAMGVLFWVSLDTQAAQFQIQAAGVLGHASIRADFGSFFLSFGLFCGYAAWKQSGGAALAAATLFGFALLGRLVTIALEGAAPGAVPPMVIEALGVAILLWARSGWKKA